MTRTASHVSPIMSIIIGCCLRQVEFNLFYKFPIYDIILSRCAEQTYIILYYVHVVTVMVVKTRQHKQFGFGLAHNDFTG